MVDVTMHPWNTCENANERSGTCSFTRSKKDPALEQFLMEITEENIHGEVYTGPTVRNEVW